MVINFDFKKASSIGLKEYLIIEFLLLNDKRFHSVNLDINNKNINTLDNISNNIKFISKPTIRRVISSLINNNFLFKKRYLYGVIYELNYDMIKKIGIDQNEQVIDQNEQVIDQNEQTIDQNEQVIFNLTERKEPKERYINNIYTNNNIIYTTNSLKERKILKKESDPVKETNGKTSLMSRARVDWPEVNPNELSMQNGIIILPDNKKSLKSSENKPNNNREILFELFWDKYDLKKEKKLALKEWKRLSDNDIIDIGNTLEAYIRSTPNKQYRKYPHRYLKNRSWENEIITINKFNNNELSRETNNRDLENLIEKDHLQRKR